MSNTYQLCRNIVEEVHVREFFVVEADSLEEAKELINTNEVYPTDRDSYFSETIEATDAEERTES